MRGFFFEDNFKNYCLVESVIIIVESAGAAIIEVSAGASIIVDVVSVAVELSVPLPQAVKTPARAMIAKNFFIVLVFFAII